MNGRVSNIKDNLMAQVEKLYKNCNEKSYGTRARHKAATERFCEFLATEFSLQKFANIKDKHLITYVEKMKSREMAPSTIKTDLSGIRFYHRLSGEKFKLPDNKTLKLQKTEVGEVDRAWSQDEIAKALDVAEGLGRRDVVLAIKTSINFGDRIAEVCKMKVWHITKALENDELYVKGKGGQVRYVPVKTAEQKAYLNELLQYIKATNLKPDDYIISDNVKHGVKNKIMSLKNFISNHRHKFTDENRADVKIDGKKPKSENLTFHGLRYVYAQNFHIDLEEKNDNQADEKTSEAIGHHRKSVTKIYLSKAKK